MQKSKQAGAADKQRQLLGPTHSVLPDKHIERITLVGVLAVTEKFPMCRTHNDDVMLTIILMEFLVKQLTRPIIWYTESYVVTDCYCES